MSRWKTAERIVVDNSPAIFSGLAVAGTITTAVLSARATYHATRILDSEGLSPTPRTKEELLVRVKLVGTAYVPAISSGVLTIGFIVAAKRIGTRRAAAMAAAYSLSERSFDQYRKAVTNKLGESQERALRDDLQQCIIDDHPVTSRTVLVTGAAEVLCYEPFTDRYFESSVETIRSAVNFVNQKRLEDGYVSLSEFYDYIQLPRTSISDELGWQDEMLEISYTTTMSSDSRPCVVIAYNTEPIRNYHRFH